MYIEKAKNEDLYATFLPYLEASNVVGNIQIAMHMGLEASSVENVGKGDKRLGEYLGQEVYCNGGLEYFSIVSPFAQMSQILGEQVENDAHALIVLDKLISNGAATPAQIEAMNAMLAGRAFIFAVSLTSDERLVLPYYHDKDLALFDTGTEFVFDHASEKGVLVYEYEAHGQNYLFGSLSATGFAK